MPDLGPTQTLVLRALEQGPLPADAVQRAIRRPLSVEVLHGLRGSGLTERLGCSNGCWTLTDEGRRALEEMS